MKCLGLSGCAKPLEANSKLIRATISYQGLQSRLQAASTPAAGMREIRAEVLKLTGVSIRRVGLGRLRGRSDGSIIISDATFETWSEATRFKFTLEGGPFVVDVEEVA